MKKDKDETDHEFKKFCTELYGRELTDEDMREIRENVTRLFEFFRKTKRQSKKDKDGTEEKKN